MTRHRCTTCGQTTSFRSFTPLSAAEVKAWTDLGVTVPNPQLILSPSVWCAVCLVPGTVETVETPDSPQTVLEAAQEIVDRTGRRRHGGEG